MLRRLLNRSGACRRALRNSTSPPSLEWRLQYFATNAFNTVLRLVLRGTMRVLKNFVS
jgi:hypothetical protein